MCLLRNREHDAHKTLSGSRHLNWLRDHGEFVPELVEIDPEPAEIFQVSFLGDYEINAIFGPDFGAPSDEELERCLRGMRYTREDLLKLVHGLSPDALEEEVPYLTVAMEAGREKPYRGECPAFDPQRSRANRKWIILTAYLCTWLGASRSDHPEASVAAVGAKAEWITKDHPLHYPYGPGSPLAKLCKAEGKVLLLGAPLNTLTILHHAETLARIPNKCLVRYKMPLLREGKRVWVEIEDIDTRTRDRGRPLDAADLVKFAVQWLERAFGGG